MKTISFYLSFVLCAALLVPEVGFALEISARDATASPGEIVDVCVEVKEVSSNLELDAFGMIANFDPDVLEFVQLDKTGSILETFSYLDSNELEAGKVKVGGVLFGDPLLVAGDGVFLTLRFQVKPDACADSTVELADFMDDIEGASSRNALVSLKKMTGHWKFDEPDGDVALDSSGQGRDGTIFCAARTDGILGGALDFNGDAKYVGSLGDMSEFATDSFTVMMWAKAQSLKNLNYLFHSADDRPGIYFSDSNRLVCKFKPGADQEPLLPDGATTSAIASTDPLPVDRWVHVACTWDGENFSGYVDGRNVCSRQLPFFILGGRIVIGRADGEGERSFDGLIDDVRIYNFALTEDEICAIARKSGVVYVDSAAAGLQDGASWEDAFKSLQQAIETAEPGAEVWVAQGVYKPEAYAGCSDSERCKAFQLKNGVSIYGGFDGTETTRDQRDWRANATVLSGDLGVEGDPEDNCYNVFYHDETSALDRSAILDGFTVTGGYASGRSQGSYRTRGAAMYNLQSSPSVFNCAFTDNSAQIGGAIYNDGASPLFSNCEFTRNSCFYGPYDMDNKGGAIAGHDSTLAIVNCVFSENTAQSGAAVFDLFGDASSIQGCLFFDNTADFGGVAFFQSSSADFGNCTFAGNVANLPGGATFAFDGYAEDGPSHVAAANSILWDEDAQIWNHDGSLLEITGSAVQGGYEGAGNIALDPLFSDTSSGDFSLSSGSPCIDAGDSSAVADTLTTDLAGAARIADGDGDAIAVVDMGAYEFAYEQETATVEITVELQGYRTESGYQIPLAISLLDPDTGETVREFEVETHRQDSLAAAEIQGVVPGVYDIQVVGAHSIANLKESAVVEAPRTTVHMCKLPEGDANSSGTIDGGDFSIFVMTFGKICDDAGFNPKVDFNDDCKTNSADFSIFVLNYRKPSPVECP